MHHNPKLPNLIALAEWLEAGAPHWDFDMATGCALAMDTYSDKPIPTECGTAGCIAGAAFMLSTRGLPEEERARIYNTALPSNSADGEFDFHDVATRAMLWLGLTPNNDEFGHDLFAPGRAPVGCTARQAAAAVRNVIAGREPWEGVV